VTVTVIGPVVDELGQALRRNTTCTRLGALETRTEFWAMPAGEVRHVQADTILVDVSHSHRAVGEVVHLERSGRHLWAVAHVDSDAIDPDYYAYWSAEATFDRGTGADAVIDWLSLTYHPAQTGLLPLQHFPGKLDYRGVVEGRWKDYRIDATRRQLLERAASTAFERRSHPGPLIVHEKDGLDELEPMGMDYLTRLGEPVPNYSTRTPAGMVRWRPGRILSVR
jgi:hypothetical protein